MLLEVKIEVTLGWGLRTGGNTRRSFCSANVLFLDSFTWTYSLGGIPLLCTYF